jgi:hypothetical protein
MSAVMTKEDAAHPEKNVFQFVSSNYKEIVDRLKNNKIKFVDTEFPPTEVNLGKEASKNKKIKWMRLS